MLLGAKAFQFNSLNQGEHQIVSPFGWRAEEVYEMMGVDSSRATTFLTDVLGDYERLDQKRLRAPLSGQEKHRLSALRAKLRQLPSDDPVQLATELANLAKQAQRLTRQRQ